MFADRALLQTVRFGELPNGLPVFPRAQAEHQLLPDRFRQRFAPMEHLIAAQPYLLVIRRAHAGPLQWHLLPHHHAVAPLATPPIGRPFRLALAALADQFPDFFLHQQIHQLQAGLTNELAHAFAQPAHHLGHGQHHLYRRISFRGHGLPLLHSALRFNLVWFLHSDSPFLGKRKLLLAYQGCERRVATFYDLPGIPVFRYSFYQWGFAYYEQGRLKAFEYKYNRTPSNINDALEKVGLKQTSQPREDLFIISWSVKSGPLVCCGFEMESLVLMRDLSKITVRFNRKIGSLK